MLHASDQFCHLQNSGSQACAFMLALACNCADITALNGHTCFFHLAGFDVVSLIQDNDLRRQIQQLIFQLRHKVVAGDQELELLAFQLTVLAFADHVNMIICDAQPLVQSICPLLCTSK